MNVFDTLVVDDDAGIRDLLVDYLREQGRVVASAADGRAAVAALERNGRGCRLVFTDIAMPGADGFAVLTAARAANPSAYVVMITGYGSLETAINAVRLGAQDYLTKPFSLGQVDVVLKQANARHDIGHDATSPDVAIALAAIHERLSIMERQLRDLTTLFHR